jgi:hypothetical protein
MLAFVAISIAAFLFSSCHPSRVWATKKKDKKEYRDEREDRYDRYDYGYTPPPPPPPPRYPSVSLIISPTPGFVMKQGPNGRFYHRSVQGFLYWKGYDNRFYLDAADLGRVSYSRWEYDEWRRYNRQSR